MYYIAIHSFLISFILTPFVRFLAIKFNVYDHPSSDIKTHKNPVPYLGGAAIFLAIFTALIYLDKSDTEYGLNFLSFFITLGSLFILGTLDDIFKFSARLRLVIQFVAFFFFIENTNLSFSVTNFLFLNKLFTLFWLVGITNAFNIIDIMDGLSSGVAIIISIFLAILAYLENNILVLLMSLSIGSASLGFIGFNFSRRLKIFMGDGGSTLLGAVLGMAALLFCAKSKFLYLDLMSIIILFGIPLYDMVLVIILRIRKGLSPFIGSRDHFALRMVALGFGKFSTVFSAYNVSIALGLISIVIHFSTPVIAILVSLAMILLGITWGKMLAIIDISESKLIP